MVRFPIALGPFCLQSCLPVGLLTPFFQASDSILRTDNTPCVSTMRCQRYQVCTVCLPLLPSLPAECHFPTTSSELVMT